MIILGPGPVTTSAATKAAMLRDHSPNVALTVKLRQTLVGLVNGDQDYAAGRADLVSLCPDVNYQYSLTLIINQ
jgi:hypothetical protein